MSDTAPDPAPEPTGPSRGRRRAGPMALIVAASVLMFFGVLSIWINRQILDTDNWAKSSSQMLDNATIRAQVSNYLVDQLYANTDVQGRLEAALPTQVKALAGPASGALKEFAVTTTNQLLQRPRVQAAWEQANRRAHRRLLSVLDGGTKAVSTANGTVTLDLNGLLTQSADNVGVGGRLATKIPPNAAQLTVLKSDQLATAQSGLRLLRHLPVILIGLALLLSGIALALARGWRRQAIRAWGIGLVCAGLAALVAKSVGGGVVVGDLATTEALRPTVAAVWSIQTGLLNQVAVATIAYGLVAVAGAWLAGPTSWATSSREALAPYLREPWYAWGGLVVILLLIVWWGPTPATRNPLTGGLLALLLAFGLEGLRRQTKREFPDASLEESHRRLGERMHRMRSGAGERVAARRGSSATAATPAPDAGPQQRIDALANLARLHSDGVLDDAEFDHEKALLLSGAPGPGRT